MALASSSTLRRVLVLVPAAHSVPCTDNPISPLSYWLLSIVCFLASVNTYQLGTVLTQDLWLFPMQAQVIRSV